MDEIAELGIAYERNGNLEEAHHVHSINLKLPYLIHEEEAYHAPLQNSHFLSGFNAAYCLVLLERYDEAVDLLEKIFAYAAIQCKCCRNHEPLASPLLCGIDMQYFHGEFREEDYLYRIECEEFAPLHKNPRFQTLLHQCKALQKQS